MCQSGAQVADNWKGNEPLPEATAACAKVYRGSTKWELWQGRQPQPPAKRKCAQRRERGEWNEWKPFAKSNVLCQSETRRGQVIGCSWKRTSEWRGELQHSGTGQANNQKYMCDFGFEPWTSPIKGYYHLLTLSKAASDWPTRLTDKRKTKEKV